MLRHITDLYLVGSDQYSEEEIDLIDDVFVRLVATIEQSSRALLSLRLAPVPVAPPKILRLLACDDAIDVASPVLTQAEGLDIETLIECARTKNQEHLLAISRRKRLPDETDRRSCRARRPAGRVEYCEKRRLAVLGPRFQYSDRSARGDDTLTSCVAMRADCRRNCSSNCLATASEKVRSKLEAEREYTKADIDKVVDEVAGTIQASAATQPISYAAAQVLVESMQGWPADGRQTTGIRCGRSV